MLTQLNLLATQGISQFLQINNAYWEDGNLPSSMDRH